MSKYTDLAKERRSKLIPGGRPVYNCSQAAVHYVLHPTFRSKPCQNC